MKWGIGLPVALMAILGLAAWSYQAYESRPKVQDKFGEIKLNANRADVKFLKGEPVPKHSDEDAWFYYAHSGSGQEGDAVYIIQFRGDVIRHITYWANERQIVHPYVQGFSIGSPYDHVIKKMGPPSYVSTSHDGLNRLLSYEKYQTFFEFTQGKVRSYGVYAASSGPMRYTKEAPPGTPGTQ